MSRALELAASADHRTSPNPMVGAVVLDEERRLAGEGFHTQPGAPHAERAALEQAGSRARGGTLICTLEPCTHHGRTPPCTDAIKSAGVRRVVVAMIDPDQRARGQGIQALLEVGIEVQVGVLEEQAQRLNEFYTKHRSTGRPFVTAKFAASLDGRIATRTGDSKWITQEEARKHAHRLRHQHDAVLVGVNTVLHDDPELTARFEGARQPLRIVLDSSNRTPLNAKVRNEKAPTLIVTHGHDLPRLLDELGEKQILSLLVEGGGAVLGSFFDTDLVDKVCAYISPTIIGGAEARPAVAGRGPSTVAEAKRLQNVEIEQLGLDLLIQGYVHGDR